ncbi:phage tail protein [Aliikangiella sp. G2MR2-5]|uniref:phage tail protein n=1 Tax=Aliikangiella sp. G2MR2-5 TaxID=2788943 RepID=UPI0018A8F8C6|nr:tail fiber protein [Aliikangiella sp. G2MR2-5]
MSEPYIGEIRMFAGNFTPRSWANCSGQLLSIAQNNALFALLGTTYGGDGRTTFALPDFQGRIPVHQGLGPGLTPRVIGQKFGSEKVTLNVNQIPNHNHAFVASLNDADSSNPASDVLASQSDGDKPYAGAASDPANFQQLNSQTIGLSGGGLSHTNMMPSLCVNFIICLFGIFPSRS